MKRVVIAAAGALVLLSFAQAQATELTGRWATESSGGIVEISSCGEAVCGRLVGSPYMQFDPTLRDRRNRDAALRTRLLKNLPILSGFKGGPTAWPEGQIYNPDTGRTYRGSMELLTADTLRVKACLAAHWCKVQTWIRLVE